MKASTNDTGMLKIAEVGDNPDSWQNWGRNLASDLFRVAADNLTRQETEVMGRPTAAITRPWYEQPVVIGGAIVAALVVALLLTRRR
jgi:hypothetical protein